MLRSMAEAGKSLTLMTVKLKNPMNSIRSRAQALQINVPGTNIGRNRRYCRTFGRMTTILISCFRMPVAILAMWRA